MIQKKNRKELLRRLDDEKRGLSDTPLGGSNLELALVDAQTCNL